MPHKTTPSHQWPAHFQPQVVRTAFGGGKLSSFCLALEAWRRGLEVTFLGPDARRVEVSDQQRSIRFDHSRASLITKKAYKTVESKFLTSEALRAAGVPTPESQLFHASETGFSQVRRYAEKLDFPVVLKPQEGSMGSGVFANITTPELLERYYHYLVHERGKTAVVLERHHAGDDYRVFVVGNTYVAACRRVPANVIGDGSSTVQQLIKTKNAARKKNPFLSGGLIRADYEVREMLSRIDMTLQSVPAPGRYVQLREKANASAGGDVVDVTDDLPSRIRDKAVEAVQAVPGLPAAGVDILWDPSVTPEEKTDFVVIEMNSRAHIGVNMYPTHGTGRDLPKAIVDTFFPDSSRPDNDRSAQITFDREPVRTAITSGIADRVHLKPLPPHGFPVRLHYTISEAQKLSTTARVRLTRLAKRLGVSGELRLTAKEPRLVVAGPSEPATTRIVTAVTQWLDEPPTSQGTWEGPVQVGFSIT